MLRRWRGREQRAMNNAMDDAFGMPSRSTIQDWSDEELHRQLASNGLWPEYRAMAERELRRREAWDAPAGRAIWISCAALAVAILSLIVSLAR